MKVKYKDIRNLNTGLELFLSQKITKPSVSIKLSKNFDVIQADVKLLQKKVTEIYEEYGTKIVKFWKMEGEKKVELETPITDERVIKENIVNTFYKIEADKIEFVNIQLKELEEVEIELPLVTLKDTEFDGVGIDVEGANFLLLLPIIVLSE